MEKHRKSVVDWLHQQGKKKRKEARGSIPSGESMKRRYWSGPTSPPLAAFCFFTNMATMPWAVVALSTTIDLYTPSLSCTFTICFSLICWPAVGWLLLWSLEASLNAYTQRWFFGCRLGCFLFSFFLVPNRPTSCLLPLSAILAPFLAWLSHSPVSPPAQRSPGYMLAGSWPSTRFLHGNISVFTSAERKIFFFFFLFWSYTVDQYNYRKCARPQTERWVARGNGGLFPMYCFISTSRARGKQWQLIYK